MPAGLVEHPHDCTASFNHNLTGFHLCGFTKNSSNSELTYRVACPDWTDPELPQFLLLRKFVANQTDTFVTFRLLGIEEVHFCKLQSNGCSINALFHLKLNDNLLIRAWLPRICSSSPASASNCRLIMCNGFSIGLGRSNTTDDTLVLKAFTVTWQVHLATLHCRRACQDGTQRETAQLLQISNWEAISSVREFVILR
uniref:Uncharacterized protein n=1 Tax=Macrostomum lignano TaxID=282301 RepID=A0A1I8GYY2_9PLAT